MPRYHWLALKYFADRREEEEKKNIRNKNEAFNIFISSGVAFHPIL